jgi:hypothetical protein
MYFEQPPPATNTNMHFYTLETRPVLKHSPL